MVSDGLTNVNGRSTWPPFSNSALRKFVFVYSSKIILSTYNPPNHHLVDVMHFFFISYERELILMVLKRCMFWVSLGIPVKRQKRLSHKFEK